MVGETLLIAYLIGGANESPKDEECVLLASIPARV